MKSGTLLFLSVILGVSACHAGTIYSDQTAFISAITTPYAEDTFTGLSMSGSDTSYTFSSNGYGYTLSASAGGSADPLWAAGGLLSANAAISSISLDFSSYDVTAVGLALLATNQGWATVPGSLSVAVNLGDGTTETYTFPDVTSSTFFGFTSSSAISSVTISNLQSSDVLGAGIWATLDTVDLGSASVSPAPEPAATLPILLSFTGLGLVMKRRFAGLRQR
jgi:hypothetical protein